MNAINVKRWDDNYEINTIIIMKMEQFGLTIAVVSPKDEAGIANSEDSGQTAPLSGQGLQLFLRGRVLQIRKGNSRD